MSEKKNILVVEDNSSTKKFVKMILEKADYNVSEASNGEEAIEIYRNLGDIDLIITDIYMPQKTGLEFVVELRKENKDIDIIIFSDGGENNFSNELGICEALGATYFMKKEMIMDELVNLVDKILS